MRLSMKNYYEILEVNEKASKETIAKVFKLQIKNNHPDLFQGDEKKIAEEKINNYKEQIAILKEELIKKQTILQQLREELGIDKYIQNISRQNDYNKYVQEQNVTYSNIQNSKTAKNDHFSDLKYFLFRLLVFLLIIIGALFMLGQILDKDLIGELFNRFFGN